MLVLINAVFRMSLVASLLYLVVHILRPVTGRAFSATWHYIVSAIMISLLVVPLPLLFTSIEIALPGEGPAAMPALVESSASVGMRQETSLQPLTQTRALGVFMWVVRHMHLAWLTGVVISALVKLNAYRRFRVLVLLRNSEFNKAEAQNLLQQCQQELGLRHHVQLATNDSIGTPMLTGCLKPVIMLPRCDFSIEELRYIFLHELVHLKRRDLWLKAATLIATALHWFNPASYLLVKEVHRWCELSCDEAVVETLDFSARKNYAAAILATLGTTKLVPKGVYSTLGGKKEEIKRRLSNLLNYGTKKRNAFLAVTVAVILAVTGIVAATTTLAQSQQPAMGERDANGTTLMWPVPSSAIVASGFGTRVHPITGKEVVHAAIDISAATDEAIVASSKGTVVTAEYNQSYGNVVVLDHGEGLTTLYAHASKLLVGVGEQVVAGQEIAKIGSTGYATGPQLHFEVQVKGVPQNPLDFIPR